MNVVALYKTFRGEEFVEASLESIYPHVSKILFVNSDISWTGERGENTVRPVVQRWASANDKVGKISELNGSFHTQDEQYRAGIKYIQDIDVPDFILLIDTDEIIEKADIERAYQHAMNDISGAVAYRCMIHAYVKSVFYRVEPEERCHPVLLIRGNIRLDDFKGPRGLFIRSVVDMTDVHIHHFTMVRNSWDRIVEKIKTSHEGDQGEHVDIDTWKKEKWDKIPNCTNLHPTIGAEHCWATIRSVGIAELPEVIKKGIDIVESRSQVEGRRQSKNAVIKVGRACNAKCAHCEMAGDDMAYFLPGRTVEQDIKDAANGDCTGVIFSGGEPTLHPDILQYVQLATVRNMTVEIETHGSISKKIAKELIEAGVSGFIIPLYGAERLHNKILGLENAREKQIHFLKSLPKNIRLQVKFISSNETDGIAVLDAARVASQWNIQSFNCIYHSGKVNKPTLSSAVKLLSEKEIKVNIIRYDKDNVPEDLRPLMTGIYEMYKPAKEHDGNIVKGVVSIDTTVNPDSQPWTIPENRQKWLREHCKGFNPETHDTEHSTSSGKLTIEEALKRAGLPEDYGPNHPDWGTPSKMHRYQEAVRSVHDA